MSPLVKRISILSALIAFAAATPAAAAEFKLSSPTVKQGAKLPDSLVFNGFGCTGGNISPDLSWTNPPAGTKSFAITVYDPDAPTGSGWWHWVVFNIPAEITHIDAGTLPAGAVESRGDFGKPGFGGACPPPGSKPHHYIFTVYAEKLDKLPIDPDASGALAGYFINQNSLGKASITALYNR
jgi:Raf kinase inhibitor-like YbhB/YbcL family protein